MNTLYIIIGLSFIATIALAIWWVRQTRKEGFENVEENPLVTVMGTIRRMSTKLMDINMWKERIVMSNMTPVELARYHIKSMTKSEDAKTV
jgi:hypothetical protein